MRKINNKGITLMALVMTIVLLIILASIGTYSGVQVVKSAQFTAFSTELKIMQTQVNLLYDKKRSGEKVLINNEEITADSIGEAISDSNATVQEQAKKVFTQTASGITENKTDYRFWNTDILKSLNIEGVEGKFFVNVNARSVVSYDGMEYEGKTYYTLKQLPDSLYNVEYNDENKEKPTFSTSKKKINNNKWQITVNNISFNGNINKWKVLYRKVKENAEEPYAWNSTDNYNFLIKESGNYKIKIANGSVESDEMPILAQDVSEQYQQVEYIKLNNTTPQNSFIKTNITISDISTVICKYDYENFTGTNDPIFLSSVDSNNLTAEPFAYTNKNNNESNVSINPINEKSENLDATEFTITYSNDSTNKLKIGGSNDENSTPVGRYYYIKIKDKNNKLIFNGIPCYRKSDNEIGLYDTVKDEFYAKESTEQFEKGTSVSDGELNDLFVIE